MLKRIISLTLILLAWRIIAVDLFRRVVNCWSVRQANFLSRIGDSRLDQFSHPAECHSTQPYVDRYKIAVYLLDLLSQANEINDRR